MTTEATIKADLKDHIEGDVLILEEWKDKHNARHSIQIPVKEFAAIYDDAKLDAEDKDVKGYKKYFDQWDAEKVK